MKVSDLAVPSHGDDVHSWLYLPEDPEWGMPVIEPYEGPIPRRWLPFPGAAPRTGTHFFVVDERFERTWRRPVIHAQRLLDARPGLVLSPDFSVWREMPWPVLQWQTYRNRWLGAFWQSLGLRVVPTVGWAGDLSPVFWAGLPRRATLAVATIGLTDRRGIALFEAGLRVMEDALEPRRLLVYGGLRYGESGADEVWEIPYAHWWHRVVGPQREGRVLSADEERLARSQGGAR